MVCWTNWIQAVAAICLVGISGWTLYVLIGYARDTKTIAGNSVKQNENSQMPFIALVEDKEPGHSSKWLITNQGFGPALNISYSRCVGSDKPPFLQPLPPLAPSELYRVENADAELAASVGFEVNYESLSGKKYRTLVKRLNGAWQHSFERPD